MQDSTATGGVSNLEKNLTPATGNEPDKEVIKLAYTEAEKDIEDDGELTGSGPNDDLDEEESARLSEDTPTPVI